MAHKAEEPGKVEMLESLESEVSEEVRAERIRRMKALVRQMHKEELEPQRKFIPQIRGKSMIAAVSLLAVSLFAVSSLYNYNRFINLGEQVKSNKGHVEAALQRRSNLFANLVNLTLNHAALEEEIFRHVADMRTELDNTNRFLSDILENPEGGAGAAQRQKVKEGFGNSSLSAAAIESSMTRLLAIVEQYPDIQSSLTYQQLMDKLVEIENRIAGRRDQYNDAVRLYNRVISSFPWFLLAKATGFSRYEYYEASEETRKGPILSPRSFERLLPDPVKRK